MRYLDGRRCGWDTETTSTDPAEARIVTAAIVAHGGGRPERVQSWLINPGVPIPPETTAIHGIDDARAAADGQDPAGALEDIASTLATCLSYGMPVVAFNTAYDWSVLHYELVRHGMPTMADRLGAEPLTLIDPHVIDREMDRYRKGPRKLKTVCEVYGIELTDWHTAEADARAALLIADVEFERYPRLRQSSPAALFAAQRVWRAEQATSLQAYLRRTDPTAVVEGAWPLITSQEATDAS